MKMLTVDNIPFDIKNIMKPELFKRVDVVYNPPCPSVESLRLSVFL
jgi:hypothetical protein